MSEDFSINPIPSLSHFTASPATATDPYKEKLTT